MQLDNLLGNEQLAAQLAPALKSGRLPHAILLVAEDGCGRNFAARLLAADYLFMDTPAAAQAVLREESPEVITLRGQGKSGQISVEAVRNARAEVFRSALSAKGRVVHIRNAHYMTQPAANALLKVLEEPPSHALFILTAPSASALPFTIVSRCSVFVLQRPGEDQCVALLRRHTSLENAQLLVAVYDRRLGEGLRVCQNEGRQAILTHAIEACGAIAKKDSYALMCVLARYEQRADDAREKRSVLLGDICALLSACMRGCATPKMPVLPPKSAAKYLPHVLLASEQLAANVSPKICFTALAVRLFRENA